MKQVFLLMNAFVLSTKKHSIALVGKMATKAKLVFSEFFRK